MEVTALLETDHEKVSGLFAKLIQPGLVAGKKAIFEQLTNELELHAEAEEAIFYPKVRTEVMLRPLLERSETEHNNMRQLIREAMQLEVGEMEWSSVITKLEETVKHHVTEEETKLFPEVRRVWPKDKREKIGEELEGYKSGLKIAI